jgi:hypothetical protein
VQDLEDVSIPDEDGTEAGGRGRDGLHQRKVTGEREEMGLGVEVGGR